MKMKILRLRASKASFMTCQSGGLTRRMMVVVGVIALGDALQGLAVRLPRFPADPDRVV